MKTPNKPTLFDNDNDDDDDQVTPSAHDWRKEWKGMPEFVQEERKPFSTIMIRFANKEDLDDFANKIGQKLTQKTKSIWHPQLVRGLDSLEMWYDES